MDFQKIYHEFCKFIHVKIIGVSHKKERKKEKEAEYKARRFLFSPKVPSKKLKAATSIRLISNSKSMPDVVHSPTKELLMNVPKTKFGRRGIIIVIVGMSGTTNTI